MYVVINLLKKWFTGVKHIKMVKKYNSNKNITIKIPKHVEYIIETLINSGFEAYAVGGCIRDTVLGREPGDWDITTSALPMEIKGLFKRTVDTGIKHGTVTVMFDKIGYEVTTYRIDGEYEDYRHPNHVEFTGDLLEDLKRRDFTINAMAYNQYEGLIDSFGGLCDIENRLIRCVGDPEERFLEDALRTLRAIRFSAQLSFAIEKNTIKAISEKAYLISNISKERIQVELDKILTSSNPDKFRIVYETGLTSFILPEFDLMMSTKQNSKFHKYSVGEHTLIVLKNIRDDHYLRWAALLHDIAKPMSKTTDNDGFDHFYGHAKLGKAMAKDILKELRFDNKTTDIVSKLIEFHDEKIEDNEVSLRKSVSKVGKELYDLLIEVFYADLSGKSDYAKEKNEGLLNYIKETFKKIIEDKNCLTLKDLKVKGSDLIEIGIIQGKAVGSVLNSLLEDVLVDPQLNNKEILLDIVKKNYM